MYIYTIDEEGVCLSNQLKIEKIYHLYLYTAHYGRHDGRGVDESNHVFPLGYIIITFYTQFKTIVGVDMDDNL